MNAKEDLFFSGAFWRFRSRLFLVPLGNPVFPQIQGPLFPATEWENLPQQKPQVVKNLMDTPACREFKKFVIDSASEKEGLKTDGLAIIKDGKLIYEWYDGVYNEHSPHCLWSASKTVMATMVGVAAQEGRLSLDDRLQSYFPRGERRASYLKDPNEVHYDNIRLKDLVSMSANFRWREAYDDNIKESTVLKMVYTDGVHDMASYALSAPMEPLGPGESWIYSGGNSKYSLCDSWESFMVKSMAKCHGLIYSVASV